MNNKTEIVITAKDETGAAFSSAKRGLDSLKTSASGVAGTFASLGGAFGLIAGAGFIAKINSAIDELDALNLSAERLGVSASKLETLNFAGKLAGLGEDDIEKALTKISVKLEEAAIGSKSAIAWFDKLGVSWKDAAGNAKTADKAFEDISTRISEMEDGTGKVAILVDGFGEKLGRKLAPALNSGSKGLEATRKELELLGGSGRNIDDAVKQADEFKDSLDKLAFWAKAAGRALTIDLLPSLNDTATAMLDLAKNGQGTLAILRGIAGIGKIPFDLALGPSKADTSVAATIADRRKELAGLENDLKSTQYGGLLGKFIFGKKEDIENKIAVTKNQIASLEKFASKIQPEKPEEPAKPKVRGGLPEEPKPARSGGGARTQIDEADRLIASLNEQIALKKSDAESTDKMTAAEQQAIKVRYQLEAGTLKATESQKEAINARLDSLVALDAELAKQKEFAAGLKRQEEANAKAVAAMVEQTIAAEEAADAYGLSATAISAMTEARLADAIAIANQNAGMEEQARFLEEELERRQRLTAALEKNDLARLLSNTKTAQDKKTAADIAILDRALAKGPENGGIDQTQYDEAVANMKNATDEMTEFAKQAARNIQDAFANFIFGPFKGDLRSMLQSFVDTVRKMAAEALAANILKNLFGADFSSKGELGGLIGSAIKAFGFADGGIMTSAGPLPLRAYAGGGIANSPQLAMFGEGSRPEAYVPLPDGRNIPVKLQGWYQGGAAQNIRIINAFDHSVIGDYLGSAAGEKIIMNAVQRNAGAFRQALA